MHKEARALLPKTKKGTPFLFLIFLFLFFLLNGITAQAQLRMVPLEKATIQKQSPSLSIQGRMMSDTLKPALDLPFWDDFSFTRTEPTDSLWFHSQNTTISNELAVLPPSFNTATFDGLDSAGIPYSQDPTLSGEADNLISHRINLGPDKISSEEQASVYLSFYWQLQGRGERPDSKDSLKLFFLASDSVWYQVWQKGGSPAIDSAAFQQELISLKEAQSILGKDTTFFHDDFRFRFASYNRKSGMFDLWHVDYVYLDKGRTSSDRYYLDRSMIEITPSLFQPYTALPIEQFFAAPDSYIKPILEFTAFNLEPPSRTDVVGYNIFTYDVDGNLIADLNPPNPTIQNLWGQQHWTEQVKGINSASLQPFASHDSLYLRTTVWLDSEDDVNRPFFYNNDTLHIQNVLHDYFAYDDGTAEYAMEVGGSRGLRIAYEFDLEVQDTLTHIDLYLPFYLRSVGGQIVDLKIWKRLGVTEDEADSVLYTFRDVPLTNSQGFNKFNQYELPVPLVLEPGTFYIGLEKRTDGFLAIGFDRNTNSREKVFVSNDQETWFAGQEEKGSLMMRPRFSRVEDPTVLGIRERTINFPVKVFPNPSTGLFMVESEEEAKAVQVYNMQGQVIWSFELEAGGNRKQVDLQELPGGFYLLKLIFKGGISTQKIFIKH